ncbi:hypothetical protein GC089_01225 [Cellulomonas sp. JZ18]|uniref:hypothetical protein n=1 Tax=Cellulomonas sp. JZ18 TaxID=2654191 RepID=UPI0012D49B00|nr:hypothetical protein [Cellulomonas sp. JZ18]QGQ18140.1 hypothetical protein GC089_01225 [Cellulomonas sp. JZ18]
MKDARDARRTGLALVGLGMLALAVAAQRLADGVSGATVVFVVATVVAGVSATTGGLLGLRQGVRGRSRR